MNPPAALYGAMSKDRKPFTYTPGGLDLSEIKSERMAKRLMRNAMNQGVPEVPVQQIQSPTTPNPISVSNFNCLPVQVFPAFNLPANPKSLLRTRSNPDHPRDPPIQRAPQPSQIPKPRGDANAQSYSQRTDKSNYQRPVPLYEENTVPSNVNTLPRTGYANNETTAPFLPEISFEAEYFQTTPRNSYSVNKQNVEEKSNNSSFLNQITETNQHYVNDTPIKEENNKSYVENNIVDKPVFQINQIEEDLQQYTSENLARLNEVLIKDEIAGSDLKANEIKIHTEPNAARNKPSEDEIEIVNGNENIRSDNVTPLFSDALIDLDFSIEPLSMDSFTPASIETKPDEEESRSDDEQKVVKVVKKQVKKENKSEVSQNGDQNGDGGVEAALTVKLPTKKSAAKTETKVEVVKRQLPDGSIEEVQTTTTKTTVDGKTTISTKTETTIIPKEEEEEVEDEEEEEEEEEVQQVEENGEDEVVEEVVVKKSNKDENSKAVLNGTKNVIVTSDERSETQTTKKVTVIQNQESDVEEEEVVVAETKTAQKEEVEEEEENEVVEAEEEKVPQVKQEIKEVKKVEVKQEPAEVEEEEEEEEEVAEEENQVQEQTKVVEKETKKVDEKSKIDDEQEDVKVVAKEEKPAEVDQTKDDESEYTEEEYESEKEEAPQPKPQPASEAVKPEVKSEEIKEPITEEEAKPAPQPAVVPEPTVPLREPSIPLEKVEDVEIKPISLSGAPVNESVTKTVTQNTEITTTELPTGPLSTQTEYNRIENTVTVNRTTKTLDHSYEQLTQLGVPTVKTYFPPNRERVSTSPQPSKPYQPVYPPTANQPTERRHSLLLERLSTERQMPTSDIYQNYQYNNQSYEQQRQWSQEPQAEVLTVSNVKPSKITNQQWYQQNNRDNAIYNNVTPTTTPASQTWPQPPMQSQPSPQPQQQYVQQQYQPSYTENTTNSYQQNNYTQAYTPKPSTWGPSTGSNIDTQSSNVNTQQNQYSYLNQNSSDSYQNVSQQYSSSYVPPPWEQDSSYVVDTSNQNQYQAPPTTNFTPSTNQGWNPPLPKSKFNKTPPTAYIPPAPNQSFVRNANNADLPRVPGKKTYYSEYERRYITVPESNYVPGETKYQPQPDPSPQYYYDNNEPVDNVEPQWRKELREFTEKTSQTTEQVSVQPPWQEDAQYAKTPTVTYTPTPSWSQTLRPQTCRERSFESEYVGSQEFSKTNTLGRGRPLSSYGKSNIETIPERSRGVSVDRYNPNSYHSPAEHSPVQTHTMNVVPPSKGYHNPNVPAYHASRASAEPQEQPIVYQQPRAQWGDRASPLQSRSFKYLQWITGTEN